MNKLEQLNKQIAYHKEQLNKLRLVKSTLRERVVRREYEDFYWSVVGKYYKLNENTYKIIYDYWYNSYLNLFCLKREGYSRIACIIFDEYNQEYYKSSVSLKHLKQATEITEQEFWKHNKKYENNKI
jgi:hypothetical protein